MKNTIQILYMFSKYGRTAQTHVYHLIGKTALMALLTFACSTQTYGQMKVEALTCEHLTNPTVVDVMHPRLSWMDEEVSEKTRNDRQTAYRICVSSSKEKLLQGKADVWDSGKRNSSDSYLIPYNGPRLLSGNDYWWRVMVWNGKHTASRWSEPAHWGMGILTANEWKAQWIGAPWDGEAPLLRKSFHVKGDIVSAKAFVTGLGYFEFYMNGKRVGNDYFVPGFTNYTTRTGLDKAAITIENKFRAYRVMYLSYDVTDLLTKGENVAGAIVGDGFYNCIYHWVCPFGKPCFLCQIVITYKNGEKETICSDLSWRVKKSAIVVNGVYKGEVYDANKETADWASASGDDSTWEKAIAAQAPVGTLTANMAPTDKVTEVLHPISLTKKADGSYEADFGKEISGWIRFKDVEGRKGDTLDVKYLCECPLGVQKYIFKGEGKESYAPRFTWYVFSKAIIKGVGQLSADNLVAEAVNTDVKTTAVFRTSNSLFNNINEIWRRSQTDNMHGCIASDCPHRERSPYTGDGQVSCVTVMHNYDAAAFYQKWVRDMRDCQNPETGYVPNGTPWQPGCGGGVAWGAAINIIPWEYYVHYGDREMLDDNYFAMKEHVRNMLTWLTADSTMYAKQTNVGSSEINYWLNLGEWAPAYKQPADELVHTFFLWRCADYTARAARVLGKQQDASYYAKIADNVKKAFHHKFYDKVSKSYGDYGSNIFALCMGVPKDRYNDVVNSEREEIGKKYNGHLNTGMFGTQFFFETLSANGMHDLAYEAMNKRDFPSFGNWIRQGATTTWEQWDGRDSHNHPMLGGSLNWFYRTLAGVNTDEKEAGYKHIIIKPIYDNKLTEVYYSNITPYGKLVSEIKRQEGMEINVTVPVGCYATVYLPTTKVSAVTENGKPISKAEGVKIMGTDNGLIVLNIAQGSYRFKVR
jgi:alpha-L-rhamnosidase